MYKFQGENYMCFRKMLLSLRLVIIGFFDCVQVTLVKSSFNCFTKLYIISRIFYNIVFLNKFETS